MKRPTSIAKSLAHCRQRQAKPAHYVPPLMVVLVLLCQCSLLIQANAGTSEHRLKHHHKKTTSSLRGSSHRQLPVASSRIVGGRPAADPYPFFMEWVGRCGGSIIWEDMAMSAAHCDRSQDPFARRVYLGAKDRGEGVARNMAKRIPHPDWDATLQSNIAWDFLLIKLNETIDGVEGLSPIALNTDPQFPAGGEPVKAIGYGRVSQQARFLPDQLREVNLQAFSDEECYDFYGKTRVVFQNDSQLCAGVEGGGKSTCQGDSGGPLFDESVDPPVQLGVVSWGEGCGSPDFPGVYARVSAVQDWIQEEICKWSCYPPMDGSCEPEWLAENECAKPNVDGRVNLMLEVYHDRYPAETAIVFEHIETATEFLFQDYETHPTVSEFNASDPVVVRWPVTNGRNGTYHLIIADSARDGICCDQGRGNVTIYNTDTGEVLFFNDNFTDKMEAKVHVDNFGRMVWNETEWGNVTTDVGLIDSLGGPGGDFDPTTDPQWPGPYPEADETHTIFINIRYDQYPEENYWVLERKVAANNWTLVEEFDGGDGIERRQFKSHPVRNLQADSLYRFTLQDETWDFQGDGMCCEYGNGWITMTNGTRAANATTTDDAPGTIVWKVVGYQFSTSIRVHLMVDSNGHVTATDYDPKDDVVIVSGEAPADVGSDGALPNGDDGDISDPSGEDEVSALEAGDYSNTDTMVVEGVDRRDPWDP